MSDTSKIQNMNKQLKVYINESSFISMKCRNRLLKMFEEEFSIDLDIGNYKNVDLSIQDDYKVLYREDLYTSNDKISSIEDLEERFQRFQERADQLIKRKDVDFQGRRNFNNFTNLMVIVCLLLLLIGLIVLVIYSLIVGNYFDCLWFLVFIAPVLFPKIKENLRERILQAKQYIKSLLKKVK